MPFLKATNVTVVEKIDGVDMKYGPGHIFFHPDEARAARLLGVKPANVVVPTDADFREYADQCRKVGIEIPDDKVKAHVKELEGTRTRGRKAEELDETPAAPAAPAPKPRSRGRKAEEADS